MPKGVGRVGNPREGRFNVHISHPTVVDSGGYPMNDIVVGMQVRVEFSIEGTQHSVFFIVEPPVVSLEAGNGSCQAIPVRPRRTH